MRFSDVHKTIGNYMLADGMSPVIDLDKSHGSWLVDGKNGDEYLDLFSMFASLSVGYNHPYVLDNIDRLTRASVNKPANSDIYSPEMAEFVDIAGLVKGASKGEGLGNKFLSHISCLLYTSPSPRDATLSRMPSSA